MPTRTSTKRGFGDVFKRADAARAKRGSASAKSRASARSKPLAAKRTATFSANAIYQVATAAVMDIKEEKYYKGKLGLDLISHPALPTTGNKICSVLAFSTTTALNPDQTTLLTYAGQPINSLEMLAPFTETATNPKHRPYSLDGKRSVPTKAQIAWSFERSYVRLGGTSTSTQAPIEPIPPGLTVNDQNLYRNLPMRCRMIRVTPKLQPGVSTAINPTKDLFLDQFGLEYGVVSNGTGGGTPAFESITDCEFAKINTRMYTVLGDDKWTLGQPITATWRGNFVVQEDSTAPGHNYASWSQVLDVPKNIPIKRRTTSHQLASKKGGEVYYDDPETQNNATSGHRREYIFCHFWYENGEGSIGGAPNPKLTSAGAVPDATDISIFLRPESRFKDV